MNLEVFNEFPIIQTKRMTLRQIFPSDAVQVYEMRSNGRLNQFIARENMEKLESAQDLINRVADGYRNKTSLAWSGILRDKKEIIGTCGFNNIDHPNLRAEIGGELDVNYWGKGIALEAVEAIVNFGFETLGLHSIEAKVDPNNRGVLHILSHLGFVREAHFKDRIYYKGEFRDMSVYTCFKNRES
jgi:[ribosomal protein S5]-alanine N-acetyltransferase